MKQQRSRKQRRVRVRTIKGEAKLVFKKRKPGKAKCGNCGALLKGVPRERPHKMRTMNKSRKRPERPYGGVLCSKCMREKIREEIRK